MDTSRLNALFERYLADGLSADEQLELFQLLHDPANQQAFDRLLDAWWEETSRSKGGAPDPDGERRIRQVMEAIRGDRPKRRWGWNALAAACVLLIFSVSLLWKQPLAPIREEVQVKTHEITTAYGQKKTVRMTDGSVIHLNAGSKLRYTDDYNGTRREVVLQGEAFFDVAKNPEKPFIVHHAQLDIEVLGTSFNVRGVDRKGTINVAVASGLVTVKTPTDTSRMPVVHTVSPGQELTYDRTLRRTRVSRIDDMKLRTAWKDGVLVLRGHAFADVASMLERWYDVQVSFNRMAMQHCRFTGEFRNLPVNKVLDLLALSSGFTYRIAGKTVYIDGKACN